MAWGKPDFSHLPVTIRRWNHFKREIIEIRRDFITVREKGLFGEKKWSAPVSAFKGVLWRTEIEVHGDIGSGAGSGISAVGFKPIMVHVLELVHPDQEKTLFLYKVSVKKVKVIDQLCEDAARALKVPVLHKRADGTVGPA